MTTPNRLHRRLIIVLSLVAITCVGLFAFVMLYGADANRFAAAGQWIGGLGAFFAGGVALWESAAGEERLREERADVDRRVVATAFARSALEDAIDKIRVNSKAIADAQHLNDAPRTAVFLDSVERIQETLDGKRDVLVGPAELPDLLRALHERLMGDPLDSSTKQQINDFAFMLMRSAEDAHREARNWLPGGPPLRLPRGATDLDDCVKRFRSLLAEST